MSLKTVSMLQMSGDKNAARVMQRARLFELHRQKLDLGEDDPAPEFKRLDLSADDEVSFQAGAVSSFSGRPNRR